MQLHMFLGKTIISVEKEMRGSNEEKIDLDEGSLLQMQIDELIPFIKEKLAGKVANVKITNKLDAHPCVITVEEMGAARHFMRTQSHQLKEENRFALLQPQLEINPKHPIIKKKLYHLTKSNPELALLLTNQLFANGMVGAGLADDPRTLLTTINELLVKALEKH